MEKIITQYLDGDTMARDYLLDSIIELHNNSINKQEAIVLLYKKYGKPNFIR